MARDRRLTATKLVRAKVAMDELLACADLEYRAHIERAARAITANARWVDEEIQSGGAPPDEDEPPAGS